MTVTYLSYFCRIDQRGEQSGDLPEVTVRPQFRNVGDAAADPGALARPQSAERQKPDDRREPVCSLGPHVDARG